MKKALKIAGLAAAGLVGIALYFTFPELQIFVAGALGAMVAYTALKELVENATRRVIRQELEAMRERLSTIDRKVSAVQNDLNSLR